MNGGSAKLNEQQYPSVIVAGGHELFQKMLRNYINRDTDYSADFMSSDRLLSMEQIKSMEKLRAVFVCYELQNCHGADYARAIKAYNRDIAVIGFSYHCTETKVLRMLDAGVKGFLSYDCHEDNIENALHAVIAGCYYYNCCLTKELYEHWLIVREFDDAPHKNRFSREESQIISLIYKGRKHDEIAAAMQKTKKSIDNTISYLLMKTNKRNSHELVHYALKHDEIEI